MNYEVRKLLVSGMSLRRAALHLRINRKTVARKLVFLGQQSKLERLKMLRERAQSKSKFSEFQFDEMETFERSKCLPLSIPLVVDPSNRHILSFRVAEMPANGPLASISRAKYGPRRDERRTGASQLFQEIAGATIEKPKVTTDQNPKYPNWLKQRWPELKHIAVKGKRGCIVGQGELKKIGFDPLFAFNHTAAMIRANVNRLFRRTWCTTKRRDRLEAHLELYIQFHNSVLTG